MKINIKKTKVMRVGPM